MYAPVELYEKYAPKRIMGYWWVLGAGCWAGDRPAWGLACLPQAPRVAPPATELPIRPSLSLWTRSTVDQPCSEITGDAAAGEAGGQRAPLTKGGWRGVFAGAGSTFLPPPQRLMHNGTNAKQCSLPNTRVGR